MSTKTHSYMNTSALLWVPSGGEIIIILVIVVLLFGAKKIPDLMKGVGKGIKEFKNATKNDRQEDEAGTQEKIDDPKRDSD